LGKFRKAAPEEQQVGEDGTETFEFKGHTIRDSAKQRKEAVSICKSYVAGVVMSMHDRFADNDDAEVLTALGNFFNPTVPRSDKISDVDVVSEYLGSVGSEGAVDGFDLFLTYMHSLVDSGSKIVRSSRDAANIALKKRDLYPAAAESAQPLLVQ